MPSDHAASSTWWARARIASTAVPPARSSAWPSTMYPGRPSAAIPSPSRDTASPVPPSFLVSVIRPARPFDRSPAQEPEHVAAAVADVVLRRGIRPIEVEEAGAARVHQRLAGPEAVVA